MASNIEDKQYGFDERRFEMKVSPNFLCSICLNVLKEPKMCGKNEHVFCHDCITPHLANFQTCPECMQHLTPETLKSPPRLFLNCLCELKIYCNYNSRGCPAIIELGHLQNHEDNCEFAPVKCGNKGCEMEVNKKDKDEHEKFFCKVGAAACHNCEDLMLRQKVLEKKLDELTQSQKKVNAKVDQIKENFDEMKGNQADMQRNAERLEAIMCQQFQDMKEMIMGRGLGLRADVVKEKVSQEIIIAGGYSESGEATKTVEMSSLPEITWSDIAPMNLPRGGAASCVRGDDFIVTGGGFDSFAGNATNTIEILTTNQRPRRWMTLNAKLPAQLFGHQVVIYQGKLLVIGGGNWNERKPSNAIYEVLLTPPYTIKLLCRMIQPRVYHRVHLMNGKLFVLGGSSTSKDKDVLDSVIVYHIEKNEFQPCLPLPYPVHHMSAVTWRSKIILLGGTNEAGNDLDEVTMYDTETQTSSRLPPMKYKRRGSSAVIFHDRIIVMGGKHRNDGYLDSVESLRFGDNRWQEHEVLGIPRQVANAHGFWVPV